MTNEKPDANAALLLDEEIDKRVARALINIFANLSTSGEFSEARMSISNYLASDPELQRRTKQIIREDIIRMMRDSSYF
jgi:hypothetical protein